MEKEVGLRFRISAEEAKDAIRDKMSEVGVEPDEQVQTGYVQLMERKLSKGPRG